MNELLKLLEAEIDRSIERLWIATNHYGEPSSQWMERKREESYRRLVFKLVEMSEES